MRSFESGEIYFSHYPKFVQIPGTTDFNIDSVKPNATPRPLIVLQEIDKNRIIAVPISSDNVKNNLKFPSYVPIHQKDYPEFLNKDSFIKTNQIQIMDTKWLHPAGSPQKVGQIKPVELDRVQIITLFTLQNETQYAKWISELVAKHVQAPAAQLEQDIIQRMKLPERQEINPSLKFDRGDVRICHFQPDQQGSTERFHGTQKGIILTDAKYAHIPPIQTVAIPLIPNKPENKAYFSSHDVVFGKDRACVSQIQPMNKGWMEKQVGKLNVNQMMEVDRSVITSLGLKKKVMQESRTMMQQQKIQKR